MPTELGARMTFAVHFPGDDNFVLWRIQHAMYTKPEGIGLLYAEAELRYSAAIRLLAMTTDLWEAIQRHDERTVH